MDKVNKNIEIRNIIREFLKEAFDNEKVILKSKLNKGNRYASNKILESESYKHKIQEFTEVVSKKGLITVYRCINDEYNNEYNGFGFFAINKEYSEKFGENCYSFIVDINRAKILNLEKWNKLYTQKTGKNGNLFNRQQGLFVIGSMAIDDGYEKELKAFSQALGESLSQKFTYDFNTCDAIYGEDAGYPGEFVFAIKNKSIIKQNL